MGFDFLIPIVTYPGSTPKDGLRRALNLAAKLTGRLTAVVHEVEIAPVHGLLGDMVLDVGKMVAEAEARSKARGADIASWLEERADRLSLPLVLPTIKCRPEAIGDQFVQAARTHDFTLMALDSENQQQREVAESLIFGSGGPVLVVAAQDAPLPLIDDIVTPKSIFVAWDGSRAAARALRDAVPVLATASMVSIVTVEDDKAIDAASISGVREFLAHRRIETRHVARTRGNSPIGDVLQAAALADGADLLVMGAYGHSRIREFVLGGATRTVLDNTRLPILLSH